MSNLRIRVTLIYTLLLLLALGLLALLVRAQMAAEYRDVLHNRLVAEARLGALEANLRLNSGGGVGGAGTPNPIQAAPAELQNWVRQVGAATGTRVTIVRNDGVVLADSEEDSAQMENHAGRPEIIQALGGPDGVGAAQRHSATVGQDLYYVAAALPADNGPPPGVFRVAVPISNIETGLSGITTTLLGTVLLVGVLALVASILFSRVTLRPLEQMAGMAARLGKGDMEARLAVNPGAHDEMSQLANAFNEMAARLAAAIGRVVAQRDDMNAVLQQMAEGLIMTDERCEVQQVNQAAARMLGIDEQRAVGKPFIQVLRDHDLNAALHAVVTKTGGNGATHEISYGPYRLQVALAAVQHAGRRNGLAVLHDVTELRRLERARSDFVANISHELRTPMASIKLLVETLESAIEDDPDEARAFLKRIDVELDGLTQLVRELLELSRVELGRLELRISSVDPGELIRSAASRLAPLAERSGLTLDIRVAENLPRCAADPERIEHVLLNLLHNAIKYTHPGGHITLAVEPSSRQPGSMEFSVTDTGIGIPPEDLPRMFERFYKVDKARSGALDHHIVHNSDGADAASGARDRSHTEGGTGLGLAIAKHLVQAHGGSIWATSTLGEGSTFYFTLPGLMED